MTTVEIIAYTFVFIGLLSGGYIAAQRPSFWLEFGRRMFLALSPLIFRYVTKRMDPATEKAWRDCQLRGGKWNHHRKKCE